MAEAAFSSNTLFNATSVKLRLRALSMQKRICTAWVRQIEERVKITAQVHWRIYGGGGGVRGFKPPPPPPLGCQVKI